MVDSISERCAEDLRQHIKPTWSLTTTVLERVELPPLVSFFQRIICFFQRFGCHISREMWVCTGNSSKWSTLLQYFSNLTVMNFNFTLHKLRFVECEIELLGFLQFLPPLDDRTLVWICQDAHVSVVFNLWTIFFSAEWQMSDGLKIYFWPKVSDWWAAIIYSHCWCLPYLALCSKDLHRNSPTKLKIN